jgi:methylsterol monooxygenase/4-alpha-methyl-delta7-sterol-4alpha-methyl oxidase
MFGTDKLFRAQQKKLRGGKEGAYPAQFRGAPNVDAMPAPKEVKAE